MKSISGPTTTSFLILALLTTSTLLLITSTTAAASPDPIPLPAPDPVPEALPLDLFSSKTDNPPKTLEDCGKPHDILVLDTLTFAPDPPSRGNDVTLTAIGDLKEEIVEGARLKVVVKIGPIKVLDREMDLCAQLEHVGKSCPVPKGETVISSTFGIPAEAPPGRYTASLTLLTNDWRDIACVKANVRL
ncbi:Phosphatidylglycerol/phosphatidylinositol transfer protein [Blyttiomyces sp. JEL0837]|nr:Phosphatidylglycerol/phosphatidylinositol transfer protein [Blyttiomyces sp. JEL0837]